MAEYAQRINISGEFKIVGKAFKPESKAAKDGKETVYPNRFELYVLYCDSVKDGLYKDKPFVGTAKVTLEDFVSVKSEKTVCGRGSVYGDTFTVTELDGMTIVTEKKNPDELLAELMREAGLSDKAKAEKTVKEQK